MLYPKALEDKAFEREFSPFVDKGILIPATIPDGWILPKLSQKNDIFEAIMALFALKKKFRKRVKYFFSFELLFDESYRDKIFFALLLLAIEHIDRSRNVQFIEEIGDIFNKDLKNTLLILSENRSFAFDSLLLPVENEAVYPDLVDEAVFVPAGQSENNLLFSIKSRNINQILSSIAALILGDIPVKIR